MNLHHKAFTLAFALSACAIATAAAQTYPSRPVRLIVATPAGGSSDIVGRLIGQWLSERLGRQFIVENRPGAGTNIAIETAVRAAPDGYTLLLASTAATINATLYAKLNYNFIRDIAPVSGVIRVPNVIEVNLDLPAKTLPELIAHAKANPGKINAASPGSGTGPHMAGELFKMMAGIDMTHVPYRGTAPAHTDLISGEIQLLFDAMPSSLGLIKGGKVRPLAVTTAQRSPVMPDLPSVAEFVPDYEASSWWGIGAPAGTPREIVERLNKEINAAFADAGIRARFADLGGTVLPGSPADFTRMIAEETAKWAKVIKFAGLKPI